MGNNHRWGFCIFFWDRNHQNSLISPSSDWIQPCCGFHRINHLALEDKCFLPKRMRFPHTSRKPDGIIIDGYEKSHHLPCFPLLHPSAGFHVCSKSKCSPQRKKLQIFLDRQLNHRVHYSETEIPTSFLSKSISILIQLADVIDLAQMISNLNQAPWALMIHLIKTDFPDPDFPRMTRFSLLANFIRKVPLAHGISTKDLFEFGYFLIMLLLGSMDEVNP